MSVLFYFDLMIMGGIRTAAPWKVRPGVLSEAGTAELRTRIPQGAVDARRARLSGPKRCFGWIRSRPSPPNNKKPPCGAFCYLLNMNSNPRIKQ